MRFSAAWSPKCVLFENVPGLASRDNLPIIELLRHKLGDIGYHLGSPRQINAADLGVPQRRVRCVMIASKCEATVELFDTVELTIRRRTVRDAIGHLPALASGEQDPFDAMHFARSHQPIALERLAKIPRDGGSRSGLPARLQLSCHRGRRKSSFGDVYGRMRWDDVAPTLTTGCTDVTRGRFAHPDQDRAITLREAALLQTFPPDYRFDGSRRQIVAQIGNAVPLAMVEALALLLRAAMSKAPG